MRWVLIVLVVLILAGLWTASVFVPDLRWFAELLTAIVVVPPVVMLVVFMVRSFMRRSAADRASAPVDAHGDGAERAAIRAYVRSALSGFERTVGRRGLAERLPLYLTLGPPGGGKSKVLEALGLARVSIAAPSGPTPVMPPPFELWCSHDAAFLELARGPAAEAGKSETWIALLDELRRARPRRPAEGFVLMIGAPELQSDPYAVREQAAAIRARLDEAVDRLGLVLPAYLLCTKVDLVPGFTEFWADLTTPDEATWGATFSPDDDLAGRDPRKAVERELDGLAQALHVRLLERLPVENDAQRRVLVLRFPIEFRALAPKVAQFVEALCRPTAASEHFFFRGLYLTSASQGAPTQTSMGQFSPMAPMGTIAPSKRYFVSDVLRSIILPDRNFGAQSGGAAARRSSRELRVGLVALGIALLLLTPALVSYVHNVGLADATDAAAIALKSAPADLTPGTHGDPIEQALDVHARLEQDAKGYVVPGWFGPRAARDLRDPTFEAYVARIHAWFLGHLRPELEKQLESIAAGHVLADAPSSLDEETPLRVAYDTVKLDATLVQPKGHAEDKWAADQLAKAWRRLLPEADAVSPERLTEHAHNYLMALEHHPDWAWPASRGLVAARERLRKLDARGMPYRRVLLWAKDEQPIRASTVFSAASLEFLDSRGDVQVPGAYTANGWQKIREALRAPDPWPSSVVIERWVLDDANVPPDERSLREQVRQTYFDEYSRHWMAFLEELKVRTPQDAATASSELAAFKQGDGFYKTLFNQFAANVIRTDEPEAQDAGVTTTLWNKIWGKSDADAGPTRAAGPSPVERNFHPLLAFSGDATGEKPAGGVPSLDKYLLILDNLKTALDKSTADGPKPPAGEIQKQFADASTGVAALLDSVEEPTRGRLWRLLMPPVKGGMMVAKAEEVGSLTADWKTAVWTAWEQKLSGHFPFRSGAAPANFGDFTAFFRPDGIIWGFVKSHLADTIEENGEGRYQSKPGTDPLAPDALACLSVAQEITDAFFHEGEDPGLKFSVQADWQASDVTDAKFSIGAKDTPLSRGTWAGPVRWFGEDVRAEWQQGGRPTEELGRHSFSLFDLIAQFGGLKALSGRSIYSFECPPLTMKLRPEGKVDALRPDFFSRLHCPDELRFLKP